MEIQTVVDLMQQSFRAALLLAMPPLLAGLTVGLCVSIFQSVTSVQEQTLVFVPKMLAVMVALVVAFSWMLKTILEFTENLYVGIPSLLR